MSFSLKNLSLPERACLNNALMGFFKVGDTDGFAMICQSKLNVNYSNIKNRFDI